MTTLAVKNLQEKIAAHRDQHAYKTLFLHFYPGLLRFTLAVVRKQEVAEEVVSDVMLNLWQLEDKLTGIKDLSVYLYRAAKNRGLNYITRNHNHQFIETGSMENILCSTDPDPLERLQKDELGRHLAGVINTLPPRCGAVYQLVKEQGLSYREVASIMGISENTVDRHLANAVHKLITAMRSYLDENDGPHKKYRPAMGRKTQKPCPHYGRSRLMKRFETLVKNKISGRLLQGEAKELQQLVTEQEDCRKIYQMLFSTQAAKEDTIAKAEQAFAAHYAMLLKKPGQ